MNTPAPKEITPHHQGLLAVLYVRTARMPGGPVDDAHLTTQRDQARYARAWGWPESAIRVIEDLGQSGTAGERPGWQRLLDLVRQGQVGIGLTTRS